MSASIPRTRRAWSRSSGASATTLGIAVLFSAHELNPLLGAIDRVLYLGGGQAVLGAVDEVVTGPVLSRLYGAAIEWCGSAAAFRHGGRRRGRARRASA